MKRNKPWGAMVYLILTMQLEGLTKSFLIMDFFTIVSPKDGEIIVITVFIQDIFQPTIN